MKKQMRVKPVSVSIRPDLALWARVHAAKKNMSRSQLVTALLENAREQDDEAAAQAGKQ